MLGWIGLIISIIRAIPDIIKLIKSIIDAIKNIKDEKERKKFQGELHSAIKQVSETKDTRPLEELLARLRG